MDTALNNVILAVVVRKDKAKHITGSVMIYIANDDDELEEISGLISRICTGMVHQLSEGVRIIVKH